MRRVGRAPSEKHHGRKEKKKTRDFFCPTVIRIKAIGGEGTRKGQFPRGERYQGGGGIKEEKTFRKSRRTILRRGGSPDEMARR